MQQPIPTSILWLAAVTVLTALLLLWSIRKDRPAGGRVVAIWSLVEDGLGVLFMLGMLYSAALQVVVRYALSDYLTLPWTEELSRLLMIWAALWGAATLQRTDDHISMGVIVDLLPEKAKRWVRVVGDCLALAVLIPIAWYGWISAFILADMYTISLGVPMTVFMLPVPVATSLMILHSLVLVVRRIQGKAIQSGLELGLS